MNRRFSAALAILAATCCLAAKCPDLPPIPWPSPAASPSPSPSATPAPSPSSAPSAAPSATPEPSPTPAPEPSPSATPAPAPSASPCVEDPLPQTAIPVLPAPCAKGYEETAGICVLKSACTSPKQECGTVNVDLCLTCGWKVGYNIRHGEWAYEAKTRLIRRVGNAQWYDAACRPIAPRPTSVPGSWTYDDICAPAPRCAPSPSPTPTATPSPGGNGEFNCNGEYEPASCAPFDHVEIIGGPGPLSSAGCTGQGTAAKPYVCPEGKIVWNSSPKVADARCVRGAVIPGVCVIPGSPVCGVPQWSTDGGHIAGEPEACGYLGHWKPPGPGAYTVTVCMAPAGCKTAHVEVR